MTTFLFAVVLAASEPPAAAALVLEVSGGVTLERTAARERPLRRSDVLRPGDRLRSTDGTTQLLWLDDGHAEMLAAGRVVSVISGGCTPADAVTRREAKLRGKNLESLRELARSGRLGATLVMARAPGPPPPQLVPIPGAVVLSTRPSLSWSAATDAAGYRITVFRIDDRGRESRLWVANTSATRLPYPEKEPGLTVGTAYYWRVEAVPPSGRPRLLGEGHFDVAAQDTVNRLARLSPLATSGSVADVLTAAWVYDAERVYDAALPAFERAAAAEPNDAAVQARLAALYALAGKLERAARCQDRALKLRRGQRD